MNKTQLIEVVSREAGLKKKEADAAVAIIKKELMRGLHYRDITVITRSTSDYAGIIDAALENAGIPSEIKVYKADEEKYKVTVINYGEYLSAIPSLNQRGCTVTVVPYTATAKDVLKTEPDGILLSNGAGDPKENAKCVKVIAELIGKKPIFGISLGHQLLALAKGADTYKLKYGHRGGSQPVKDLGNGKTYVTAQNHGYAVDTESAVKIGATVTYVNGNDGTCEGLEYASDKAFSVQFVPEKSFGKDHTEAVLFDKFVSLL